MKRLLTLVLPLVLLISACEKKEYVQPNRTVVVDIKPTSWESNSSGTYYSRDIDLPELDDYLQDRGAVLVYLSFDNERTYVQIPSVYQGVSYSYQARSGLIWLEMQRASGTGAVPPPAFMTAKIVLVESDY